MPVVRGSTRLLGLLGHPVAHSLSPVMHNAAIAAMGLDLVYVPLDVAPPRFGDAVQGLVAVGALGANVTVPHKAIAVAVCDHLTREARLVGAVNTLHVTDDGIVGDNTDVVGLYDDLVNHFGSLHGGEIVLLGTGGAARAAAVVIARLGARAVVVGRRPDAAEGLAELAREAGAPDARAVDLADGAGVESAIATADLVVNATSLGLHGEALPPAFMSLPTDTRAYDLIYNPAPTPFLAAATERGVPAVGGLGMLVGQAAAALRRWTGEQPDVAVMRAAADEALAGS